MRVAFGDSALAEISVKNTMNFGYRPCGRVQRARPRDDTANRTRVRFIDIELRNVCRIQIHSGLSVPIFFNKAATITLQLREVIPKMRHVG